MASKKKKQAANRKKRPTKLFLRRSASSKKGWETRRQKAQLARIAAQAPEHFASLDDNASITELRDRIVTLESELAMTRLERVQAETDLMITETTVDWVSEDPWYRMDGSRAKTRSALRHIGPMAIEAREALIRAYGSDPTRTDKIPNDEQKRRFYLKAAEFSEFFDVAIREVYSLFWSP